MQSSLKNYYYDELRYWHIILNNINLPHYKGYVAKNIKQIIKELKQQQKQHDK